MKRALPLFISVAVQASAIAWAAPVTADTATRSALTATRPALWQCACAPVKLHRHENVGYTVDFLTPHPGSNFGEYLLRINGNNLRGLSFEEITAMLWGEPGSLVRLELIDENGRAEQSELRRQWPEIDKTGLTPGQFRRCLSGPGASTNHVNLLEEASTNVDLIAEADALDLVRQTNGFSPKPSVDNIATLIQSMLLLQAIGDLNGANSMLKSWTEAIATTSSASEIRLPNSFQFRHAVQNLVDLGKIDEAVLLCERVLRSACIAVPQTIDPCETLDVFRSVPGTNAEQARKLAAANLVEKYRFREPALLGTGTWLGNYLEQLGLADKAMDLYKASEKSDAIGSDFIGFSSCQRLAYNLYCQARLEANAGNKEAALHDLQRISKLFREKIPAHALSVLDKVPLYFPTPSDIARAGQAISNSASMAAAPPPPSNIYLTIEDYDLMGRTEPIGLDLPTAQKCFNAISSGQREDADRFANDLAASYAAQPTPAPFSIVRQNLLTTLIRVARSFANAGWFADSNSLLDRIDAISRNKRIDSDVASVTKTMLNAERLYNSVYFGTDTVQKWNDLKANYPWKDGGNEVGSVSISKEDWLSDERKLAIAFHYANEHARAKYYIGLSLGAELNDRSPDLAALVKQSNLDDDELLDCAFVFAGAGDFKTTQMLIQKASSSPMLDGRKALALNEMARIYCDHGRKEEAIALLKNSVSSRNISSDSNAMLLTRTLSEILKQNGQTSAAMSLLQQLHKTNAKNLTPAENALIADGCANEGRYAEATEMYCQAAELSKGRYATKERLPYLRKAVSCAIRISNFDSGKLSDLYMALSDAMEENHEPFSEALEVRKKAIALMPDSNPKKAEALSVNAYIRGLIREEHARKDEYQIDSKPTDAEIQDDAEAASIASNNRQLDQTRYWFGLASLESKANLLEKAMQHARRGIACYSQMCEYASSPDQLMHFVPAELYKYGAKKESEQLSEEMVKRVEDVMGPGSMADQAQLAQSFAFYTEVNDYAKAERVLDRILRTNLSQGEYSLPNHDVTCCGFGPATLTSSLQTINQIEQIAVSTVNGHDCSFGAKVLQKLLDAQKRQLPADDRRIGLTLACLGKMYSKAGAYNQADRTFSEALPILKKYEGMVWVLGGINPEYFTVLQNVGKQDEIEKATQ